MFYPEPRVKDRKDTTVVDSSPFVDKQLARSDPKAEEERRHRQLMDTLDDERELQAEERQQMAIDEDFYDHLHWRMSDAMVLAARGQAPLVYPQARQSIDWVSGMQKRMRTDYRILPREQADESMAEVLTQAYKYTDDVNMVQWHRSKAFKQSANAGLSWIEEGVNTKPGREIIYSGSEDWRNVWRDSRDRTFDLEDSRYLFRVKRVDLDYAQALLPKYAEHLRSMAETGLTNEDDEDNIWYLGERLTGAADMALDGAAANWRDRRAFINNHFFDRGRRMSVDLIEAWYRVPEKVQVFNGGPQGGRIVDPNDPGHAQLMQDRWTVYESIRLRMRVMVGTENKSCWDGLSPFEHDNFGLIPLWGYRRYRDGSCYGLMRGMRDLQEDTNKRASKALWLLVSNRVVADKGAVEDVEYARQEAARADGWIEKAANKELRFEKPVGEVQMNLEMMDRNIQLMRDAGGVTNANLGRGASGQSGISIERQQDQGSLTVSELFDNLLLNMELAGKLRLSHIKQFWTERKALRIIGEAMPIQWLEVNGVDPDTGEPVNDITSMEADFVVAQQNYRESFMKAANESMFELMGKIATFAPQVVLLVLDLLVESSEVPKKEEWLARIRKINGQRDPLKPLSPEEVQAQQKQQAEQAEMKQMEREVAMTKLAELKAKVSKLGAEGQEKNANLLNQALQIAQALAIMPAVAPIADQIASEVGFQGAGAPEPGLPVPAQIPQPVQAGPGAVAPVNQGAPA